MSQIRPPKKNPPSGSAADHLKTAVQSYESGLFEEAASICKGILQRDPHDAEALHLLGAVNMKLGNFDEAKRLICQAITENENSASYHYSLGTVFEECDEWDAAVLSYQKAVALDPSSARNQQSLGRALLLDGKAELALPHFTKAYLLPSGEKFSRSGVAGALLTLGDFRRGWRAYDEARNTHCVPDIAATGSNPFQNRKIFIYPEQGVGDEIMFASCFNDAIANARECTISCTDRLGSLFSRSFPNAFVKPLTIQSGHQWNETVVAGEARLFAGSLPRFFRKDLASFPQHTGYLVPDPELVDKWRRRFEERGPGISVGIAWRGGSFAIEKKRKLIALSQWHPILSVAGVKFINLQYGDCAADILSVQQHGITIHDWDDANPLKDLDSHAAQIAALDLVIATDNVAVHMAGALGVPVWVMISKVANWRWMMEREDSPWYPSMRLIRQKAFGTWDDAIARITTDLAHFRDISQKRCAGHSASDPTLPHAPIRA